MKIQPRHTVDLERASDIFQGEVAKIDRFLDAARSQSRMLSTFAGIAEFVYAFGGVVAPNSSDTVRGVVLGAQVNTAMIVYGRIGRQPNYVPLGDGPPVTYAEPTRPALLPVWANAYRLAAISRQADLIAMLDSVPLDAPDVVAGLTEWEIHYVEYRRAILSATKPSRTKAFRYMADYAASCQGKSAHHKAVKQFSIPYMNAVRALESGEGAVFEAALVEACRGHAKHYGSTEKTRKEPSGFVSLDLTMLATLAYDRGLKFDMNVSDYVPAAWVRGDVFRQVSTSGGSIN